ncbi:MAG: phosphate acetyltransferase [Saccharofermentanales bacterium]
MGFIDSVIEKARTAGKTIVLPEAGDRRVVEAASAVLAKGIANIVLIGDEAAIAQTAAGLDISKAVIVNPRTDPRRSDYVDTFYEMRKEKGMTPEKAEQMMLDENYFGVMMVKKGDADGMVSGAIHSTADTLRPSLQILKTAPGTKLVSAFFMIVVPDCEYGEQGTFLFADSGLVMNPNADELSEIAISSAKSFEQLTGKESIVGMLSFSSKGSAKDPLVDKVVEATRLAREKAPHIKLDGELQLDAAIVPAIGRSKAPSSTVAGYANTLVFPDLNSGNIGYKLAQRLAKAEAYGPITQGIARPVNDLSRGCSAEDIVGVVAITAVQAMS